MQRWNCCLCNGNCCRRCPTASLQSNCLYNLFSVWFKVNWNMRTLTLAKKNFCAHHFSLQQTRFDGLPSRHSSRSRLTAKETNPSVQTARAQQHTLAHHCCCHPQHKAGGWPQARRAVVTPTPGQRGDRNAHGKSLLGRGRTVAKRMPYIRTHEELIRTVFSVKVFSENQISGSVTFHLIIGSWLVWLTHCWAVMYNLHHEKLWWTQPLLQNGTCACHPCFCLIVLRWVMNIEPKPLYSYLHL